jgi:dGTPase
MEIDKIIKCRNEKMPNYAQKPKAEDRRIYKDEISNKLIIRNEFSRDRDRIKFSRAFRRLEHKAQIYSHEKGDHFRTRLTHTLEVSQIARSLARNLNLNEDLVEAITLGHDIGHTPFGHQGERTLDNIMSGEDDLSGKIKYNINYGGFKHNFHSLKILDQLEVKDKDFQGMNLTWQVLEGILKHTKIKRCKECKEECGRCWDISKFICEEDFLIDYLKYNNSVTLEGQIVAIADEIAQRQHDVDDGLRDKDLKLDFEKVANDLVEEFEKIVNQSNEYTNNLKLLILSIKSLTEKGQVIDRKELYGINTLVRNLIDFFIKDVTINSLGLLNKGIEENVIEHGGNKIFTKQFISFSPVGKKVNDKIEEYIKRKILNSYNVNRFDGKAIYIIRQLFKAYYTNPRQMPKYILHRLSSKIIEISNNVYKLKFIEGQEVQGINFIDSKPNEINKLVKLMKLEIDLTELDINEDTLKELNIKFDDKYLNEIFSEVNRKKNADDIERVIKAMLQIHYAYLSVICDYIAGMTDNYASSEFKNLYLVE